MLILPAVPLSLLLVTPYDPQTIAENSCLRESYYGTAGVESIFITDEACVSSVTPSLVGGSVIPMELGKESRLVWLQHAAVDESILVNDTLEELNQLLSLVGQHKPNNLPYGDQQVLDGYATESVEILRKTESSVLLSVNPTILPSLDSQLPPFWKATILPESPVPFIPVPSPAVKCVKDILSGLTYDPSIASLVNGISIPQMRSDIRWLTGEDSESPIVSRHSFSEGVRIAADWIKARFEETGADCELKPFLRGFGPNVICSYPSIINTTETVLLSAHYDSRGSFGSTRAPGGDDDGSGTIALLGIARMIGKTGIEFQKNVKLCAFAGEEQGLLGSRAYARELRAADANLVLMVQADMLGYHAAGEPAQLGLPDLIGTPEVTQLVANISALYSPELKVGFTPACCSDHQSFHEQGFPATQVFERAGPIVDPMYHNSGDLSERPGYDFHQIKSIAKVQFATLLHAAGFWLKEDTSS